MPGRFAGPFNLFRDSNTKERLVKNYAAKLLASTERIVDRPGGSKFQKLSSQHGDLLFTAMVDKTGPRPLYRVFVTGVPLQIITEEQVEEIVVSYLFMESGFCQVVGRLEFFDVRIHYTAELLVDYSSASELKWLDWLDAETLASTVRVYTPGMPSLAMNNTTRTDSFTTGNYSTHSGKTLLLWQALAGTRSVNRVDYNGETLP